MAGLNSKLDSLHLNDDALTELRRCFSQRIAQGLARDGEEIRALRAYVRPPRPPSGKTLDVAVVDAGGTNARAAILRWDGTAFELVAGPKTGTLPVRRQENVSKEAFFAFQADLLAEIGMKSGTALGYCFSYPAEVRPNLDARLIRWTKGVEIPDVIGQPVGQLLAEALAERGITPSATAVLNDTVAALQGGALTHQGDPRLAIGLIVGTGTNMAGYFDETTAPKLEGHNRPMALNLESGNFCPPLDLLTEADHAVDASENKGRQRFEKAVSGQYLPVIFSKILPDYKEFDPSAGSAQLTKLCTDPAAPEEPKAVAQALLNRSADFVAAGLAAVMDHYPPGEVVILAEGTLFWSSPGYKRRVEACLQRWLGEKRFRITQKEHVNLQGAASTAFSG